MARVDDAGLLRISVVFSARAGEVDETELTLPQGATAADAIAASGVCARHADLDFAQLAMGLWGASCEPGHMLRDRDRVELYRPLRVDPKEARRQRQQVQRARR